jgi:hypothetical protein
VRGEDQAEARIVSSTPPTAWRIVSDPSGVPLSKTLRPVPVDQAEMDVEAVARAVEEGLGHEARRSSYLRAIPFTKRLK